MNRDVLLELLSNKNKTFREVGASSALRGVRDDIARVRAAGHTRMRSDDADAVIPPIDLDETRLEDIPEIASRLEQAHLYVVASFVGEDDRWVADVASMVGGPAGLDAAALDRLVAERAIDEATARRVGFVAAVYEAVERDTTLVRLVREARLSISDGPARSTLDLAQTSPAEWEAVLGALGPQEHGGRPITEIARRLAERFAAMHPGPAFVARLAMPDERVRQAIHDLEPLFAHNIDAVARSADEIDVTGLDAGLVPEVRAAHQLLRSLCMRFPDLELPNVLHDRSLTIDVRAELVLRRVGFVQRFQRLVGEDNVLVLDYGSRSPALAPLSTLDASPEEARRVLRTLKTHQRAYALGGSADAAAALLAHGLGSARAVTRMGLAEIEGRLGAFDASIVRERATKLAGDAALVAASLLDITRDPLANTSAGNVPPSSLDYLRELDGYEELFGSLSFCACEECNSILGPAAYFVDVMRFVDEHVRTQFADHPNHALDLKTRRPDLWTLPLTCENTRDRIPVLAIVDEILEAFIATTSGFTGTDVTRRRRVYETLAATDASFRTPFDLPSIQAERLLGAHNTARAEIVRVLGGDLDEWATARLSIVARERTSITTPDLDLDHHRARYGVSFQLAGLELDPVDVQELCHRLPFARDDLASLLSTRFVSGAGTTPIVVAEKRTPDSIQHDVERVHHLTTGSLDRMHRFARLQRRVPWSITELDDALSSLAIHEIDTAALVELARLLEIQQQWSLAFEDVRVLIGSPSDPWLARTFASTMGGDLLPQPARMFVHSAFRSAPTTDPMQARLAAGLETNQDDLAQLLRALAPHLDRASAAGFDPQALDEDQRGFVLSAANLVLLVRHVRIARQLELSIVELRQLCVLASVAFPITSATAILALVEVERWRRPSGYSLDDLAIATGQPLLASLHHPSPTVIAQQLVGDAGNALAFESTVFAVATGIGEAASRSILEANSNLFARVGDRWRVANADLTSLSVPSSAVTISPDGTTRGLSVAEARAVVVPFLPTNMLARQLAAVWSISVEKLRAIASVANRQLSDDAVVAAYHGGSITPLEVLVASLTPFIVAFQAPSWDPAAIEHVASHRDVYGLPAALTIESVHALALVASHGSAARSDLRAVFATYSAPPAAAAGFSPGVDDTIARILDVDTNLVPTLRGRTPLAPSAPLAFEALRRAAHLARDLGVDGAMLASLVANDYTERAIGAEALGVATRAMVAPAIIAEIDQHLLERRRDALAAYVVEVLQPDVFDDVDALSAHFLIDVTAGGCQTSSRVIAATSSVQQYVHRVSMRLEQDRRSADDPAHVEVGLSRGALDEWSWRKNYRVWEANRKVFLWPENYLEPDLRDDKTPLFVDLEQALLQGEINDQTVLDAYGAYLAGFEELANLTIAGAYHDVATRGAPRDVLHLFGVSSADPPTFYYRTCEKLLASGRDPTAAAVWTPWRKLDVQITGRRVSPVVFEGRLHVFWTDYQTRPRTRLSGGSSRFGGYQHTMRLRFTTLRIDGGWTTPQDVSLPELDLGAGVLDDWITAASPSRLRFDTKLHTEPRDDYSLGGPNWDWVWPEPVRFATRNRLFIRYRDFQALGELDLFSRQLIPMPLKGPGPVHPDVLCARGQLLYFGSPGKWLPIRSSVANLVIDSKRLDVLRRETEDADGFMPGLYQSPVAKLPASAQLLALPGNVEDAIVQIDSDVILVQGSITRDHRYIARRIGTTLATRLARTLFSDGVEGLLDIETQKTLREARLPLTPAGGLLVDRSNRGTLDFTGPYGTYYREIYFHIPALLANHLNSQGQFESAQRWYQYIFDPTATEAIAVPASTPPPERERRMRDRVWRYLELRGLSPTAIHDALTDPTALEKYRRDPFNPHAIARLRITAYQKGIVMRYIDNLLDWADHLFTQFTMESVNEAVMLYLTAQEILGSRPAELGPCTEAGDTPRTYESIAAQMSTERDLLIELESWVLGRRLADTAPAASTSNAGMSAVTVDRPALVHAITGGPLHGPLDAVLSDDADTDYGAPTTDARFSADWNRADLDAWSPALAHSTSYRANLAGGRPSSRVRDARSSDFAAAPASSAVVRGYTTVTGGRTANAASYAEFLIDQLVPAFCVPPNAELDAYWDRLDDRLYKIRHCMDITGQVRELALIEPAIDPRLLIHGTAIGAELGEVAPTSSSSLPPYRFAYLIERAKSAAATLQGFGSAFLAALEKKDAEEMSRLSLVHQKNIAMLSTRLRTLDVDIAEQSLAATELQRDAAVARRDFYQGLIDEGNNGWEVAERIARHASSYFHVLEGPVRVKAAIATALPQVGSPFAMTYGGQQIGGSLDQLAEVLRGMASTAEAAAASAALEGNYARRNEGWRHQRDLARRDVESLERQLKAASARVKQAERSVTIHQRTLDQIDEVSELLAHRFSNLGRYTWLAQQLQRLYRDAYDGAMALARLAEQAYRFERDDDQPPVLEPSYWEAGHAGLLAGERLFIGLQQLERRFLETHDRTHEIDQPISVGQIDPGALLRLRETGTCELAIPELAYDLFYPGHYRRRIKGVRLTIPCITGPYTNVSATLELLGSKLRRGPADQALLDVPPRRTTSIATSTAQNDGGVFEMSFRDERYLPFEGAGAVSSWRLALPSAFRPFDYSTITDVIISVSYTALFDSSLRNRVESTNAALEGSLLHHLRTQPLTRVFSLRQDFSAAFTRLLRSPLNTDVRFEITDRHFPLFANGKPLRDVSARLVVRTKDNMAPGSLAFGIDGVAHDTWAPQDDLGGLRGTTLASAFTSSIRPSTHTIRVSDAGTLAAGADDGAIDVDKLLDLLFVVEFKL